ncbi:hypothetical protein ACTXG6_07295 [Pseudonocardia sp. Cha107L01]|uniref:hypothetical protein n=1 Tax=Pseudonocardia sp. Cha107L01 TaxID=3457576 RepID=UPI00403E8111
MRRGVQDTHETDESPHLVVMPQPGGPSAKNARRAGSPNHQRNTSEEIPMVEPVPDPALDAVARYRRRSAALYAELRAEEERFLDALVAADNAELALIDGGTR